MKTDNQVKKHNEVPITLIKSPPCLIQNVIKNTEKAFYYLTSPSPKSKRIHCNDLVLDKDFFSKNISEIWGVNFFTDLPSDPRGVPPEKFFSSSKTPTTQNVEITETKVKVCDWSSSRAGMWTSMGIWSWIVDKYGAGESDWLGNG